MSQVIYHVCQHGPEQQQTMKTSHKIKYPGPGFLKAAAEQTFSSLPNLPPSQTLSLTHYWPHSQLSVCSSAPVNESQTCHR